MLAAARKRYVVLSISILLFDCIAGAALSLSLKGIVEAAADRQVGAAIVAVVVAGLAAGFSSVAGRIIGDLEILLANQAALDLDEEILTVTTRTPGIEHMEQSTYLDDLALVRSKGADVVRSLFAVGIALSLVGRVVVAVVLLASVDLRLTLLPLFVLPSLLLVGRAQRHTTAAETESAERRRASTQLHRLFLEPEPAMELRAFGCESSVDRRADDLWRQVGTSSLMGALRSARVSAIGWFSLIVGLSGALALVTHDVKSGGLSIGALVLVSQLTLQMKADLTEAMTAVRRAAAGSAMSDRLIELHERAEVQEDRFGGTAAAPTAITRSVRLEEVSFAYPGTDELVLRDLSFELPAGSIVAVVGDNGAGKTTLVKLLARLYLPTRGRILVDDRDLVDLNPSTWSPQLSAGFQDFLHLECSLRESVGVGAKDGLATDDEIRSALEAADSSSLIDRLPGGLDALLGTSYRDGVTLSGGQWQRVAIARAMVRTTPLLLVLDEPTSAFDPAAEHALYERFASAAARSATNGGITILVSHRFSSVSMADMIVVLDRGSVAEIGSHHELMARNGLYAAMFREQASAYR